jgi:hypothetical protein
MVHWAYRGFGFWRVNRPAIGDALIAELYTKTASAWGDNSAKSPNFPQIFD